MKTRKFKRGELFHFQIIDDNDQVVQESDGYETNDARDAALKEAMAPYATDGRNDDYKELKFYEDRISGVNRGFDSFSDGDEHFFTYNVGGVVYMISEGYSSTNGRDNGVGSVEKNMSNRDRFKVNQLPNGKWYFNLRAGNNQEIATSRWFDSEGDANAAIGQLSGTGGGAGGTGRIADINIAAPPPPAAPKVKKKRKKRTTPKKPKAEKVYLEDGNYQYNGITYQIFRSGNGKHYFTFKSTEDKTLMMNSDVRGYETLEQAQAAVQRAISHAPYEKNYEGKPTRNGKYYFYLKDDDGKNVAKSFFYGTQEDMQRAVGLFLGTGAAAAGGAGIAAVGAGGVAAGIAAGGGGDDGEAARLKAEADAAAKAKAEREAAEAKAKAEREAAEAKAAEEARIKEEREAAEARAKAEKEAAEAKAAEEARIKEEREAAEARAKAEKEAAEAKAAQEELERLEREKADAAAIEAARVKAEKEAAEAKAAEEVRIKEEREAAEAKAKAEKEAAEAKAAEEARIKEEREAAEAKAKAEKEAAEAKAAEEARIKEEREAAEAKAKAEKEAAEAKAAEEAKIKAEREAAEAKAKAEKEAAEELRLKTEKAEAEKKAAAAAAVTAGAAAKTSGADEYLVCSEYEERINDSKSANHPGFITFQHENNDKYYFAAVKDGKIHLRSEGYSSEKARDNGIMSVIKNRDNEARWSVEKNRGLEFAILKAGNGQEIARSCPIKDGKGASFLPGAALAAAAAAPIVSSVKTDKTSSIEKKVEPVKVEKKAEPAKIVEKKVESPKVEKKVVATERKAEKVKAASKSTASSYSERERVVETGAVGGGSGNDGCMGMLMKYWWLPLLLLLAALLWFNRGCLGCNPGDAVGTVTEKVGAVVDEAENVVEEVVDVVEEKVEEVVEEVKEVVPEKPKVEYTPPARKGNKSLGF